MPVTIQVLHVPSAPEHQDRCMFFSRRDKVCYRNMTHPSSQRSSSPKTDDITDVVRLLWAKINAKSVPSVGEMLPHTSSTPRSLVPAFFCTSTCTYSNYNYNYSKNLYSATYSGGRQYFTVKEAKPKRQYKTQSTIKLILKYG